MVSGKKVHKTAMFMFCGKIMLHTEIWNKFDEIAIVLQNLLFFGMRNPCTYLSRH